jgi:5-methylcytosine-specific restriction endonuclease McrA
MFGITQDLLDTFASASHAATFNAYPRTRGGSGSQWAARRARLLMVQGGICVKCGDAITETDANAPDGPHLSHLISATHHGEPQGTRAGMHAGNLAVWHKSCNVLHGEANVRIADLARPDLVFTGVVGSWKELPMLPR